MNVFPYILQSSFENTSSNILAKHNILSKVFYFIVIILFKQTHNMERLLVISVLANCSFDSICALIL